MADEDIKKREASPDATNRKLQKREWLAFTGRRHPRVGGDYQVPDLPPMSTGTPPETNVKKS
jgi:hypothetical protein